MKGDKQPKVNCGEDAQCGEAHTGFGRIFAAVVVKRPFLDGNATKLGITALQLVVADQGIQRRQRAVLLCVA